MKMGFYRIIGIVLCLCLLLSSTACTMGKTNQKWEQLAIEKYMELHEKETLQYTADTEYYNDIGIFITYGSRSWYDGKDYLDIFTDSKGKTTYSLSKNGKSYYAESEQFVEFPNWQERGTYGPRNVWGANWDEKGYVFESVVQEGEQILITFFEDHGSDNCTLSRQTSRLTMHLNKQHVLTAITYECTSYKQSEINKSQIDSARTTVYTILSDDAIVVKSALDAQYQAAIQAASK